MAMMDKASTPNFVPKHDDDTIGTACQADITGTGTSLDPIDVDDAYVPTDQEIYDSMVLKNVLTEDKVLLCGKLQEHLQLNQPDPESVETFAKGVTEVLSNDPSTDLAMLALNVVYALCLKDAILHASKLVRIRLIHAIIGQAEPVSVKAGAVLDILWDIVPIDVLGVLCLRHYASPSVVSTFLPRLTREANQ